MDRNMLVNTHIKKMRETFAWYDNIILSSGFEKKRSFEELPYISEEILSEHYYSKEPDFKTEREVFTYQTSGTTNGNRKKIFWSKTDHEKYVETRTNIFMSYLTEDCRTACADLGTGHAAASALEVFENLGLKSYSIDFKIPIQQHISLLNEHKPDVFYTMPMILDKIINYSLEHNIKIDFHPKRIITVGDVVTDSWKTKVQNFFEMEKHSIFDILGSIEVGSIAHEDPELNLYVFDDGIIPEIITIKDSDVLVLTSINRMLFPAIKFITNDIVSGFSEIKVRNRRIYAFKSILGRMGPESKHGEKINIYDINNAINIYLDDALFEVQKTTTDFIIKIASHQLTDELSNRIIEHIENSHSEIKQMIEMGIINPFQIKKVSNFEINQNKFKQSIKNG